MNMQRTLSVLVVSLFTLTLLAACGVETPVASATRWVKVEDFTASLDPAGFLDVSTENLPFRDWILRVNGQPLPPDEDRALRNMAGPFAEALVAYERKLYGDSVQKTELFRTEITYGESVDEDRSSYWINVRATVIGHSGVGDAHCGEGFDSIHMDMIGTRSASNPVADGVGLQTLGPKHTPEQLRRHRDEVILRAWREAVEEILNK